MAPHDEELGVKVERLDLDALILWAASMNPSERRAFLFDVVALAREDAVPVGVVTKCMSVAQSILGGAGVALTDAQSRNGFWSVLELQSSELPPQTRVRAISVAFQFMARVTHPPALLSASISEVLAKLEQNESPDVSDEAKKLHTALKGSVEEAVRRLSSISRTFSIDDLNLGAARRNVKSETSHDWFTDPWRWPELSSITDREIGERLKVARTDWTLPLDVPKQGGGVRPAIVLAPIDRLAYQALADEVSLHAAGNLHDWVYGWRIRRDGGRKGVYEDNGTEWKAFQKHLHALAEDYRYLIRIDVRSYFETVRPEKLIRELANGYKRTQVLTRMSYYFEQLGDRRNGTGLPQRSLASSILAHLPLKSVDAYLSQKSRQVGVNCVRPSRWMDDIWLFSNSEAELGRTITEVESLLEAEGLGLNPQKTKLVDSSSGTDDVFLYASGDDEDDEREGAESAVDEILDHLDEAPRSKISFLSRFQGANEDFATEFLEAIGDELQDYDYSADLIAGLLNRTAEWKKHIDFFQRTAIKSVSSESWTVPSWALMFPEKKEDSLEHLQAQSIFQQRFETSIQRSFVPLAAQRLAVWTGKDAIDLLEDYIQRNASNMHPCSLRACLLASLDAGRSAADVLLRAERYHDEQLVEMLRRLGDQRQAKAEDA